MGFPAHRNNDSRECGAKTVVTNQSSVYVNGELWAVEGDQNDHTNGQLIATGQTIYIEGKLVICHTPDPANPDDAGHIMPLVQTAEGSDDVFCYGSG